MRNTTPRQLPEDIETAWTVYRKATDAARAAYYPPCPDSWSGFAEVSRPEYAIYMEAVEAWRLRAAAEAFGANGLEQ
jgi:hypothetical protein